MIVALKYVMIKLTWVNTWVTCRSLSNKQMSRQSNTSPTHYTYEDVGNSDHLPNSDKRQAVENKVV